jgi:hypothetical protein
MSMEGGRRGEEGERCIGMGWGWFVCKNMFCSKSHMLAMQQNVEPPCASPPSNRAKPPSKDWQRAINRRRLSTLMASK